MPIGAVRFRRRQGRIDGEMVLLHPAVRGPCCSRPSSVVAAQRGRRRRGRERGRGSGRLDGRSIRTGALHGGGAGVWVAGRRVLNATGTAPAEAGHVGPGSFGRLPHRRQREGTHGQWYDLDDAGVRRTAALSTADRGNGGAALASAPARRARGARNVDGVMMLGGSGRTGTVAIGRFPVTVLVVRAGR